jgi:hypothetical protein
MDEEDPFTSLVDAVSQTQGISFAVYHILMELVIRLAQTQPDPSAFLKSMFESVSAKLDQTPSETAKKLADGEEMLTLSTFFSVAEKAVRRRRKGGKGERGPRQG